MLLGRSQLLLAGIPTGAALIGLLWLKHRRSNQSHHHTDPGGSSIDEQRINKSIKEEIEEIEKDYCKLEVSTIEEISDCENTVEELNNVLKKSPELTISNCTTDRVKEDIVKVENIEETKADCVEESDEEIVETHLKLSSEDSFVNQLIFDIDLVETEVKIAVNKEDINILNEEEKVATVIEEGISKEVTTETASEQQQASVAEIVETIIKKTESLSLESEIISEVTSQEEKVPSTTSLNETRDIKQNQPVVVEEDKVKEEEVVAAVVVETEEGATANMKTESTQLAEKLADLEKKIREDKMKIREESGDVEQKVCTERDSANHSPSEVMLASPSISNFSDAHSEGSSDSGKGHSDVATSPSRTPAGGSSLAGDLAPSIYEFVLPQIIVGRLIGRRGTFLHEIRSSTQTNIYIKRHPDTNKLKICAIEGSQPDIDKALAKIRQKFPLRRFPQLTLEKVSFVTLNQVPSLRLEDFHLQLVESVNNDVILSSLISAAHFFLQQPSHPSYNSLCALNLAMNEVYSTPEAPALETPIKDAVCAAPTMGGWYRAQIVNVEEETNNCTVRFLDYGGYLTMDSSSLRQIRADLLSLPFQAVECYLANVAPADEAGWTEEARLFVQNLTVGQVLQAQIYDYAEDGTPLVYLYASFGSQVVLINEELVIRGFGVMNTTSTQEEE